MVLMITSDVITLQIDNEVAIRLDSSLLLTNKSDQIFLAVARLNEDSFFLSIGLFYSRSENTVTWKVRPIVKPLGSDLTVIPGALDSPSRGCVSSAAENGTNETRPIALMPGKSENISEDIVVHLVSRSDWRDEDSTEEIQDWYLPERYHMISPWKPLSNTEVDIPHRLTSHTSLYATSNGEYIPLTSHSSSSFSLCHELSTQHLHSMTNFKSDFNENEVHTTESMTSKLLQEVKGRLWNIVDMAVAHCVNSSYPKMPITYVLYNKDLENPNLVRTVNYMKEDHKISNVLDTTSNEDEGGAKKAESTTASCQKTESDINKEVSVQATQAPTSGQWYTKALSVLTGCYTVLEMVHLVPPIWVAHPVRIQKIRLQQHQSQEPLRQASPSE